MLRFINPCNCRDWRRSAPITPCNSTALLRIRVCRKASKRRTSLHRYEFANTPVQLIPLEAGLSQISENDNLVYVRQKALTPRAKSTIPAPDWAATIAFSLATTIAQSIRRAGKSAMEFSDFSRHRSLQSAVLPILMNNVGTSNTPSKRRAQFPSHRRTADMRFFYPPTAGRELAGFQSARQSA